MRDFLGQFSKSDFFSVLPAGLYIFIVIYSCFPLIFNLIFGGISSPASLVDIFDSLATLINQQPAYIFFILFACYMLGSIFRAFPVRWAESSVPPWKKSEFPYPDILREVIDTLKKYSDATKHTESKLPHLEDELPMHVFNYWKDALCVNSIEGFDYYQTFETRVRFFCGMIWASWVGITLSVITIICYIRSPNIVLTIGLPLLVLSVVLILAYGLNFRRVRRQEARALLLIYSAYLQNR